MNHPPQSAETINTARHLCNSDQMLDWDDLRVFAVLARSGSLAGAARALRVNHATVSRRVAALEAALGVRLVDRLARSTPLTEHGAAIAALAAEMEGTADRVRRRARTAAATLSGTVTVSAPPVLASAFIAGRLGALRAAHPDLAIVLSAVPTLASLARGEADLAVRLVRPAAPGHIVRRLGAMRFALYAAPAVARLGPERWSFVAYDEPSDHLPQQRWLVSYAGARPIAFRTSDLHGQIAAVRSGVGVAALPRFLGEAERGLVEVDPGRAPAPRTVWLVAHADLRHAPAVRAAADFLVALFKREPAFARE